MKKLISCLTIIFFIISCKTNIGPDNININDPSWLDNISKYKDAKDVVDWSSSIKLELIYSFLENGDIELIHSYSDGLIGTFSLYKFSNAENETNGVYYIEANLTNHFGKNAPDKPFKNYQGFIIDGDKLKMSSRSLDYQTRYNDWYKNNVNSDGSPKDDATMEAIPLTRLQIWTGIIAMF